MDCSITCYIDYSFDTVDELPTAVQWVPVHTLHCVLLEFLWKGLRAFAIFHAGCSRVVGSTGTMHHSPVYRNLGLVL